MKKTLSAILLLSCLWFVTPACVGPYNAFNSVASWNSRVTDSKILNELIFLVMWFVPVYPIALFLDGLVFNSFEWWGAENPIGKPQEFQNQGKK